MATILTNVGEEYLVDKLAETNQELPDRFGWGTGAGTAAKGDTDVFTAASEAHTTGAVSKTGTLGTAKLQTVGSITANGTKAITNFGVFTAAGLLIVHVDHGSVAVDAGDIIEYTVTFDPS